MELNVPDVVISQALDELGWSDEKTNIQLKLKLRSVASVYLADKSAAPHYSLAKGQKTAIAQLSGQAAKLLATSRKISPEYEVALDSAVSFARADAATSVDLSKLRSALISLMNGIAIFLEKFEANQGPRANVALQEAIITLLPIVTEVTGEDVAITFNKHSTSQPSLKSKGARAIGRLLRGVDPKLTETSIVDMIDKVRTGKISPDPLDPIIEFQTLLELEGQFLREQRPDR